MADRVKGGFSHHDEEKPELCKRGVEPCGVPRVVKCDGGDWDVLECSKCGKQWEGRCNFDEDCS